MTPGMESCKKMYKGKPGRIGGPFTKTDLVAGAKAVHSAKAESMTGPTFGESLAHHTEKEVTKQVENEGFTIDPIFGGTKSDKQIQDGFKTTS